MNKKESKEIPCNICNRVIEGRPHKFDGLIIGDCCYQDLMLLGYYIPEVDDAYGIVTPDNKPIKQVGGKKKPSNPAITEDELSLWKWELNNKDIWKELEKGDKP